MPTEHSITTLEGVVVRGYMVVVRTHFIRLGIAPSRQPQGPRCGANNADKGRNTPLTPPATLVGAVGGGLRERIDRRAAEPQRLGWARRHQPPILRRRDTKDDRQWWEVLDHRAAHNCSHTVRSRLGQTMRLQTVRSGTDFTLAA